MINREKVEAGLVMEKNGASGKEIAAALGYKDEQSWWQSKYTYKKGNPKPEEKITKAKTEKAIQADADEHERRAKGLIARALENNSPAPEPAPILEGLNTEKVPVPVKPVISAKAQALLDDYTKREKEKDRALAIAYFPGKTHEAPAPIKRLTIKTEINADGETLSYKAGGGKVSIRRRGSHKSSLVLTMEQLRVVLAELKELMTEAGVCHEKGV